MTRIQTHLHLQLKLKAFRMSLSNSEESEVQRMDRGFQGEVLFDRAVANLISERELIHLKDYTFFDEDAKKKVQMDNIIIASDEVFIFEIKNIQANLVVRDAENFNFESGQHCSDYSAQLNRQYYILDRIFKKMNLNIVIKPYVVFINPRQTIYGLKSNQRTIVASNLKYFIDKNLVMNEYNYRKVAENLDAIRLKDPRYSEDIDYIIEDMRKGICCLNCFQPVARLNQKTYKCSGCERVYGTKEVTSMLVKELKILNLNKKFTSRDLKKLSGNLLCCSTIRRHMRSFKVD